MKTGFMLNIGAKELFCESSKKNITDSIAFRFIDKIGELRNASAKWITNCKNDKETIRDIKRRIDKATLELIDTGKVKYYSVKAKFMSECIPLHDAECLIIFKE